MSSDRPSRIDTIYRQSVLKPPYTSWPFVRRFWIYQNERFPIIAFVGVCGLLVVALAKLDHHYDWTRLTLAAAMAVLYFMQIRVADEPKDFEHDNKYYPKRPVQRGVITLGELNNLKLLCVAGFLTAACLTLSPYVVGLAVLQQGYSFLTRKEFFMREWLRDHFLLYQYSHYAQLLLLAWLLVAAAGVGDSLPEKLLYAGYILLMIAPIESSRTIGGRDDMQAHDRYSHRFGFTMALGGYLLLTFAAAGATVWLIGHSNYTLNPLALVVGLPVVGWAALRYMQVPVSRNATLLNMTSLIMYVACTVTVLIGR